MKKKPVIPQSLNLYLSSKICVVDKQAKVRAVHREILSHAGKEDDLNEGLAVVVSEAIRAVKQPLSCLPQCICIGAEGQTHHCCFLETFGKYSQIEPASQQKRINVI